jgi:phosphate transport system protein
MLVTDVRRSFHQELETIRGDIVRLAAMVTEFIPRGTEVLLSNDLRGAKALIEDDDNIDAVSLEIEDHCYQLLALQQPMASDLRAVVTAVRLISEIERSGDLMVNVAKGARRMYGVEFEPRLRGLIEQMSEEAGRLFHLAIDAYAEGNAGLAAALDDIDDRLDDLHVDYIEAIFESHRRGALDLEPGVQLALIGRYYERIGDHAVNIGNRVQYMVTGWLPEHTGAARVQARALQAEPAAAAPNAVEDVDERAGLRLASPPEADAGG